jgi:hypothetical protein
MEDTRKTALRLVMPPFYACFLVPALVGILSAIILSERHWYLHVLFRLGDVDGAVVLFFWGIHGRNRRTCDWVLLGSGSA